MAEFDSKAWNKKKRKAEIEIEKTNERRKSTRTKKNNPNYLQGNLLKGIVI